MGPKHSDSSSIHNRSRESHESSTVDHPLSEQQERKYQKLIHPTVGVLTVLSINKRLEPNLGSFRPFVRHA
ncbi:hypothetical protein PSHT_15286 [Puccinia striiformis]|uniref:Uncharacterized protein n=1 Tax=Puccinia striiformis TaxID=27350 RepID=A0A2S4UG53_9BASI|nr:hypothetical protein PSHT_15286 [Puccinia striiformis]